MAKHFKEFQKLKVAPDQSRKSELFPSLHFNQNTLRMRVSTLCRLRNFYIEKLNPKL